MRRIFTPRWLGFHLVAVLAVLTCLRLGWWQFDRAQATGSPQNLAYALQWPLFAGFAGWWWWKIIREELHPTAQPPPHLPAGPPQTGPPSAAGQPSVGDEAHKVDAADEADEADEELVAYNRYLADLHHRDTERTR